jgi:hypothetical protein
VTDLPPLPKVVLITPTYACANIYAREHGLARRRMRVVSTSQQLRGTKGDVYLYWPPEIADPEYLVDQVRTDPMITVAPCRSWAPDSETEPSSGSAAS